ncbi:hypothetical protein HDU96_002857, partial [Phlyctochytrium bullatum]
LANETYGNDRPRLFNQRIGFRAGMFQFAQEIPLRDNPWIPGAKLDVDLSLLDERSDASIMITVYPYSGLERITDRDIVALSDQVRDIKNWTGRDVMIRFGPEMNGEYIAAFRRIATRVRADNPTASMLWSPNMDQNGDSYTDYYPGDEYVDWVGLSVYYKGMKDAYPWIRNTVPPQDYFEQIIDARGDQGGVFSFYRNFAVARGKPFALSEGAVGYHTDFTWSEAAGQWYPAQSDLSLRDSQMAWWNGFLFNATFRARYPLFKLACLFEFYKEETDGPYRINREFRTTADPATMAAFHAALTTHADAFQWANAVAPPLPSTLATTTTSAVTEVASSTTVATTTTVVVAATGTGEQAKVVEQVGKSGARGGDAVPATVFATVLSV